MSSDVIKHILQIKIFNCTLKQDIYIVILVASLALKGILSFYRIRELFESYIWNFEGKNGPTPLI